MDCHKSPILLTKEEFVDYLKFIYRQEELEKEFVHVLEKLCPGNYCDCWLFNEYAEKYRELIEKLMNDQYGDIKYFLFELERGKTKSFTYTSMPYHNEEELYDYLVKESEREE